MGRMAELRSEVRSAARGGSAPRARKSGNTPREGIRQRLDDRERLQEMEARGEIRLGTGRIPEDFWTRPRPADPERDVLNALLDQRESNY
jgi:hypothetical protein